MKACRNLFIPQIVLDAASPVPIYRQIHRQIARDIRSGAIPSGARLPSTRVMAGLLGVSRNTMLAAYDDLAAADLLRAARGSGMLVNAGAALPPSTLFGLQQVIRESGYPARVLNLSDPDGNVFYIQY